MTIEYRDIEGFPGYKIGNDGTILSDKRSKGYINTFIGSSGYKFATLYNDGKRKTLALHRLLASAFIPNPNNLPWINHKDENPLNNVIVLNSDGSVNQEGTNLEWCSRSYNRTYGTCETRRKNTLAAAWSIAQFDLDGNLLNVFSNCVEAAKSLGLSRQSAFSIGQCALGHTKQSHGYRWKRVKPSNLNNNESQNNINTLIKEMYNKIFPIISSYNNALKNEYQKLYEFNQNWEKEHNGESNDNAIMKMWALAAPATALDMLNDLY